MTYIFAILLWSSSTLVAARIAPQPTIMHYITTLRTGNQGVGYHDFSTGTSAERLILNNRAYYRASTLCPQNPHQRSWYTEDEAKTEFDQLKANYRSQQNTSALDYLSTMFASKE